MKTQILLSVALGIAVAGPLTAQGTPNFGDDSSEYAFDSECDDPRFVGWGVATSTSVDSVGTDATDCAHLYVLGQIRVIRTRAQTDVAECKSINFGDDSSDWSNDNECDDPRFTGGAAHTVLNFEDIGRDAKDCSALCASGDIWLR